MQVIEHTYNFVTDLENWYGITEYYPTYGSYGVRFDNPSAGEYISFGDQTGLQFTSDNTWEIEILYNGSGFGTVPRVMGRASYNWEIGIGKGVAIAANNLGFYDGSWRDSGYTLTAGQHYHIIGKYVSADQKWYIYVNGVQVYNWVRTSINITGNLYLGNRQPGYTEEMNGYMRNFRWYSRAITELEILEHYNHIYNDNTGLQVNCPMDETSGATVTDYSGNGYNGTVVNADRTHLYRIQENSGVDIRYYLKDKDVAGNPPLSTVGGSIKFTAKRGTPQTNNYLERYATLAEIALDGGITLGTHERVKSIKLDYQCRWEMRPRGGTFGNHSQCLAEFTGAETWFGGAELRDDNGDLIDTFSETFECIDRTSPDDLWVGYPQDPDWPYDAGKPWLTEYPITTTPPTWQPMIGNTLIIPVDKRNNTTKVRLRINNVTPETDDIARGYVRMKIDRVVVTLYTEERLLASTGVGI